MYVFKIIYCFILSYAFLDDTAVNCRAYTNTVVLNQCAENYRVTMICVSNKNRLFILYLRVQSIKT